MKKKSKASQKGKTFSLESKLGGVKYLKTEERRQTQQKLLSALEEVSQVLTVEVDLHKILKDMATIVAKALGAKWVNFWELTPDKRAAYITAMYGMRPEYVKHSKKEPILLGTAWIGRAIKTGKAWATSDILTDPKTMKDLGPNWREKIKKQDYRALLCVPTTSRRGPIGGMCVYYPKPHNFTDFEMRLVTVAANQAATSITNAQIFDELVAERNKTFAAVQSLQDGLIMYNLENQVMFFNSKAEELLWLRAKNIVGNRISKELAEKNIYWKNLYNISQISQEEYVTKEYTTEGPQKLILEITYVPVRSQYQKIGAMQILRNVTKEREVEILKSNFVSIASHQLRTPLSAIKWSLDILVKEDLGVLNFQQKDLVKKTFIANERLIHLVADLLDVSRIEEGSFGYNFNPGDIKKLVKKIFDESKISAERRNLDFQLKEPTVPLPKISFDAEKLDIALRNVIDNAIKYTQPGGFVEIELKKERNSLLLIVRDNGIGIPKTDQKFIFVKFFRARNAVRLQPEGSGLGLYIAKNITEKHNASLTFSSESNKGSTFVFRFHC